MRVAHHDQRHVRQRRQARGTGRIAAVVIRQIGTRHALAETLERGHDVRRIRIARPAVPRVGHIRQTPDHRDALTPGERQHAGIVLQQNDRFAGHVERQRPMRFASDDLPRVVPGAFGKTELLPENPPHRIVHRLEGNLARLHQPLQVARVQRVERHLEILTGQNRGLGIAHAEDEIAEGESFETPFAFKDVADQRGVLSAPLAVHAIVRGHHASDAGVHHSLEMRQVDLVQCAGIGLHIHAEPGVLHGVAGEVFDAGHHVALHAPGQGRAQQTDVEAVLAVGFLRTAPRRMAQQVDADAAEQVGAQGPHFASDDVADTFLEFHVPCGTAGHADRERGGPLEDHAARPIGETDARNTEPRRVGGGPGVAAIAPAHHIVEPAPERRAAGHQRDLLFEAELRKDFCCLRPIIRHISPVCAERRVDLTPSG